MLFPNFSGKKVSAESENKDYDLYSNSWTFPSVQYRTFSELLPLQCQAVFHLALLAGNAASFYSEPFVLQ